MVSSLFLRKSPPVFFSMKLDKTEVVVVVRPSVIVKGCGLCNTEYIIGTVIFTGHETKQSLNMGMAIVMARNSCKNWILHLDTDKLIHLTGAREYSLRQLVIFLRTYRTWTR